MKLLCLFPGIRYTCEQPLLYYAASFYHQKGYEILPILYDDRYKEMDAHKVDLSEQFEMLKPDILQSLKDIEWNQYDSIVFVSKSIGTVLACWYAQRMNLSVRQILFTPLEQTFDYMNQNIEFVAVGDSDSFMDANKLSIFCKEREISCEIYPGGHRLETDDIQNNLDTLKDIFSKLK